MCNYVPYCWSLLDGNVNFIGMPFGMNILKKVQVLVENWIHSLFSGMVSFSIERIIFLPLPTDKLVSLTDKTLLLLVN